MYRKKIVVGMIMACLLGTVAKADDCVVLSYDIPMSNEDQNALYQYCNDYSVPYEMALGVIETESSFNPDAVNYNGTCFGYMQVNQCNASWLYEEIGVENLTNAQDNLKAGIYMLSQLYEKYEDWHCALVCYNCGEPGAKSYYFSNGIYSSDYSWNAVQNAQKWAEIIY